MEATPARWLMLAHQFPAGPGSLRVRIWRRLQGIGAVPIKNALYALPDTEDCREDFAWVLRELRAGGADGQILRASLVDGMDDQQLRGLFNDARNADYAALAEEVRGVLETTPSGDVRAEENRPGAGAQLNRFRKRLADIAAIDFFDADGRGRVEGLLAVLADRDEAMEAKPMRAASSGDLRGRVWVTRRNVHVDRIASAWLIRRRIDPAATFKFVAGDYRPEPGELRFDMFDAEFTHEGNRCTFEVLLHRFGLDEPALHSIGEIVHDIDLKDGRYGREETAGIAHLVAGVVAATEDDAQRIEHGGAIFDHLQHYFRGQQT